MQQQIIHVSCSLRTILFIFFWLKKFKEYFPPTRFDYIEWHNISFIRNNINSKKIFKLADNKGDYELSGLTLLLNEKISQTAFHIFHETLLQNFSFSLKRLIPISV